jgi:hypothetical protein
MKFCHMFHAQIESSSQPFRIYIVRNMRNRLFAHSAPYFVYINVRYYRLIDRLECSQLKWRYMRSLTCTNI